MLLKRVGMQPYTAGSSGAVNEFLRSTGSDEVDFRQFLALVELLRGCQRDLRRHRLKEHFRRCDRNANGQLEPQELVNCLQSAGLVPTRAHQDMALNLAREFDEGTGGIGFREMEELAQRVVEHVFSEETERNLQAARELGFDAQRTSEFQIAFDQLDVDGTGALSIEEIAASLKDFMARPPSVEEVAMIFESIDDNCDGSVTFGEYLTLMKIVSEGKGLFAREDTFTLKSVPPDKLRDILRCFSLAEAYIQHLEPQELLENVSNFTGFDANQNLRDLPNPIRNPRQLLDRMKHQEKERKHLHAV